MRRGACPAPARRDRLWRVPHGNKGRPVERYQSQLYRDDGSGPLTTTTSCALAAGEVYAMLGDRLGESRGRIIGARVLPSEGQQIWMEVSFQGHGTLLGQEINDTGTYRQTVRPGGVLYGEGHVLMMSTAGDIVDWVGGGVGRPTGPGYQASYGVWGSAQTTSEKLARLGQVADVIEYEVEEDGSYRWTMWEWTGGGLTPPQT
jgi:hypothetical protein